MWESHTAVTQFLLEGCDVDCVLRGMISLVFSNGTLNLTYILEFAGVKRWLCRVGTNKKKKNIF